MLASTAIAKSLLDTHTDAEDYTPTTVWLEAYNIVRNKVINEIVKAKQNYFWNIVKFDLVIWQSEYNISEIMGSPALVIKNVKKVFIKYDATSDYYKPVTFTPSELMIEDPDYYSVSHSKSVPFFNIKDRSIFVYPAPDAATVEWGKMNVIYQPSELAYADEDDKIDADKQYIYSLGIAEHIYKSQGKINESNDAKADFNAELRNFITEIKGRNNAPIKKRFVNNLNTYR